VVRALYFFLLVSTGTFFGQQQIPEPVSRAQLEEKFYPADSTLPAVMLYTKGSNVVEQTGLSWQLVTTITVRIKIYTKAGYEYANKKISYIKVGGFDCTVTDAVTYNFTDGKVEKTALKVADIYDEALSEYVFAKKISMPNVREGSIIEYTYTINTPMISTFPEWYFQYPIPVKKAEYEAVIPSFFSYNRYLRGDVAVTEWPVEKIKAHRVENSILKYTATDVPAYRDEPYSGNVLNYISAIWFEMASYDLEMGKDVGDISSTWSTIANKLYESEHFGSQIEQAGYFINEVKAITKPEMGYPEKMETIFSYVQKRMAWNGGEGYSTRKGVKKAFDAKTGNVAEINLILLSMLRLAGIDAHPVILSTRDNGVALHPNFSSYNYLIVRALVAGKAILLDAASKNARPGMLPERALNFSGRMLRKDGTSLLVELMPTQKSKKVISIAAAIDEAGALSGKVRTTLFDYYGYAFREVYEPRQDSLYVSGYLRAYPGLAISGHSIQNAEVSAHPVIEDYQFIHTGLADVAAGKIYFKPLLYFLQDKNPFAAETRMYPVDFIFPFQNRYSVSVALPPGYKAVSLPEPLKLELPNGMGSFNYMVSVSGNYVQCASSFDINYGLIEKEYYLELRDFYNKALQKQAEMIVLEKE
jgi:hypothetical protein